MTQIATILLVVWSFVIPCFAVEPDEILRDPNLEARAREIGKALRCVVCQNETIDESDAELARDMRRLVRRQIIDGHSDQKIIDYMVDRYGDFVLLKPPFKPSTWVLWFGPFAVFCLGTLVIIRKIRNISHIQMKPLSAEEQDKLAEAENNGTTKL